MLANLNARRRPILRGVTFAAAILAGIPIEVAFAQSTVTWNGANATWAQPDSDSFSAPYDSGDTAVFAGSGTGTVTISGTVTPALINVTAGGYTFASGVIGGSAALTKSNAGLLTLTGNNTYSGLTTVSGGTLQIGAGSTMGTLGTGTVELQGTGNIAFNRSDAQTVTNTILWTGSSNQQTAGNIVNSGAGTLLLQGNQNARGLQTTSGAGAMTVSSGTLRLGSNGQFTASLNAAAGSSITVNSTLTEVPGGQAFLYKRGLGTVYLGNAVSVSFTGGLVIADGVLDIAGSLEAPLKGRRFVFEGQDSNVLQFSGTYSPTFGQGAGQVEWSANTVNGGFAARTGAATVNISSGTTLTYQTGSFTRPGFMASGRTLFLNSDTADNVVTLVNPINLASGTQTIQVIDNVNSSGDWAVLSGAISNGGLTKTGAGRLVLSGSNTYTGTTTISAGTLQIGSGTSGSVAGDVVNSGALVFSRSNASTFAGVVSGTGGVTKTGAGTVTFSGNNIYSGTTTVNDGTLQIGAGSTTGSLGTASVELQGTGNIAFNRSDAQTVTNTILWTGSSSQLTAGNIVNSGAGTLLLQGNQDARGLQTTSGAGAMTVSSGTLRLGSNGQFTASLNAAAGSSITVNSTLTEVPGGQAFLYKRGLGTVYLGNAVSVSFTGGLVIADGVLDIVGTLETTLKSKRVVYEGQDSNVLQLSGTYTPVLSQGAGGIEWSANTYNGGFAARTGAATVNIASGTTLTYQTGSFSRPGFLASGRTLFLGSETADNVVTLVNPINLASGTQTIQVIDNPNSSGDAAVLAGVLSNGGLTKTGAGRLSLAANNTYTGLTTISAGTLSIGSGGTAGAVAGGILNNAALVFDRSDALSFSGTIGGSGGLTKQGAGTLTLAGNSSYAGTTAVDVGGLLVDGALSGVGLTSVANGARVGGDGSLAGALTLLSGARFIFNPSATLDVAGAVTLDNSFSVSSLVAANGGAIDWASIATGTYTLINTTSTFNNISNFGVANAASIGGDRTAYFQNGSLQLVIVPEPGALLLAGLGIAAGAVMIRRRR